MSLLQTGQPIVARIVEQPVKGTSLGDVIIGAIGLTGLLLLTAALLGLLLGGVLIGVKLFRARYHLEAEDPAQALRVTPTS